MYVFDFIMLLPLLGAIAVAGVSAQQIGPMNIVVGTGPNADAPSMGWMDGVCYQNILHVRPGDTLTFNFGAHDVYKLTSMSHLNSCDFTDATPLAGVGESPYTYTVTEQDAIDSATDGGIFFSCSVGAHCSSGLQRLTVQVEQPLAVELIEERKRLPTSDYLLGVGESECSLYQSGVEVEDADFLEQNALQSECTDPVLGEDGRHHVSCLSGPATLTPGGVMNSARIMHYPCPKDRRVVVGERTWEFVEGDPTPGTLDTCGSGWTKKTGDVDVNVDSVVKKHGERLAMKHSKLGSPSLHRAAEEVGDVLPCNGNSMSGTLGDAPTFTMEESSDSSPNSAAVAGGVLGGVVAAALIILLVSKIRGRGRASGEQFDDGGKGDKDRSSSFAATRRETAYGETNHLPEGGFIDDLDETDRHGV